MATGPGGSQEVLPASSADQHDPQYGQHVVLLRTMIDRIDPCAAGKPTAIRTSRTRPTITVRIVALAIARPTAVPENKSSRAEPRPRTLGSGRKHQRTELARPRRRSMQPHPTVCADAPPRVRAPRGLRECRFATRSGHLVPAGTRAAPYRPSRQSAPRWSGLPLVDSDAEAPPTAPGTPRTACATTLPLLTTGRAHCCSRRRASVWPLAVEPA